MIAFLFISMLQTAAGAPQPAPATEAAAAATEAVPESVSARRERHRIRCRDQVVLGSRIGARVCMSRADEEAMQQETQRIADEMHRSGPFGEGSSAGFGPCQGRNC